MQNMEKNLPNKITSMSLVWIVIRVNSGVACGSLIFMPLVVFVM